MTTKPVGDVLYDSEAALRLVDNALREFDAGIPDRVPDAGARSSDATGAARFASERSHLALLDVIDRLRQGRTVLERVALRNPAPGRERAGHATADDQLDYASAVLEDVEHRLAAMVAAIGSGTAGR